MALFFWTKADFNAVMSMLTTIIDQQQQILNRATKQEKHIMSALDDLAAQVRANTDLEQSAVTLIQGIAQQLAEAADRDDSEAIIALSNQLQASAAGLAAAISANTPGTEGGGGEQPMARKR